LNNPAKKRKMCDSKINQSSLKLKTIDKTHFEEKIHRNVLNKIKALQILSKSPNT
jgi:hypothetical protein